MRGEYSTDEKSGESVWTQASSFSIKEAKVYNPSRQNEAFEGIQHSALKAALRERSGVHSFPNFFKSAYE